MKTLDMRFGNAQLIMSKIIEEIKGLPRIDSREISLVEFATRLKNAVTAIKSFDNHIGYLYSAELTNDFINKEAELSIAAGVLPVMTSNKATNKSSAKPARNQRNQKKNCMCVKCKR